LLFNFSKRKKEENDGAQVQPNEWSPLTGILQVGYFLIQSIRLGFLLILPLEKLFVAEFLDEPDTASEYRYRYLNYPNIPPISVLIKSFSSIPMQSFVW
jgi:hypothetical protein